MCVGDVVVGLFCVGDVFVEDVDLSVVMCLWWRMWILCW